MKKNLRPRFLPLQRSLSCVRAVFVIVLVASCLSHARATTYDAVTDFSTTTNTNTSTWSYRYSTTTVRDGNYLLLPTYGPWTNWTPTNPQAWRSPTGDVPVIGVNQTGSDATFVPGPGSGPFVWPNGTMLAHPEGGELAVLSWLSPSTSLININFSFSSLDPNGGNGVSWFVEENSGLTTLAMGSYADGGASGNLSLSGIPVMAGDRINFIVDPNGDFFFDSTKITATITTPTSVPESVSSFTLLFLGLIPLLAAKHGLSRCTFLHVRA